MSDLKEIRFAVDRREHALEDMRKARHEIAHAENSVIELLVESNHFEMFAVNWRRLNKALYNRK